MTPLHASHPEQSLVLRAQRGRPTCSGSGHQCAVEDHAEGSLDLLAESFANRGSTRRIGLTGAPGTGKSTLTSLLIHAFRSKDLTVAVVAVDPSSPFTGGAILGDRIRMQEHASDQGVYIRSMANRGHLGGLSAAVPKALTVLEGVGFDVVLIETVGVGQAEVEVVGEADSTVVVVTAGWGDSVQANKAGVMEIGDLFVVNKADRDGAKRTLTDLEAMLSLGEDRVWRPSVTLTTATTGEGVDELVEALGDHEKHLALGELAERRRSRLRTTLVGSLRDAIVKPLEAGATPAFEDALADVIGGTVDPWTAGARIVSALD